MLHNDHKEFVFYMISIIALFVLAEVGSRKIQEFDLYGYLKHELSEELLEGGSTTATK